jgi:hypothetical protein
VRFFGLLSIGDAMPHFASVLTASLQYQAMTLAAVLLVLVWNGAARAQPPPGPIGDPAEGGALLPLPSPTGIPDMNKAPSAGIPPAAIWAVVSVLCGLLVWIIVASRQIQLRKQAEQQLDQMREELEKTRQQLDARKRGGDG